MTVRGGGWGGKEDPQGAMPGQLGRHHQPDRIPRAIVWGTLGAVLIIFCILGGCWAVPHYNVWQQGLAGEAELKRASQNRQIAVQEAEAKRDAAKQLAQAEVERAKGVAEANRIIGESLQGHTEYLTYLWLQALDHSQSTIVYVPTEANLPLLEASRLQRQPQPEKK